MSVPSGAIASASAFSIRRMLTKKKATCISQLVETVNKIKKMNPERALLCQKQYTWYGECMAYCLEITYTGKMFFSVCESRSQKE